MSSRRLRVKKVKVQNQNISLLYNDIYQLSASSRTLQTVLATFYNLLGENNWYQCCWWCLWLALPILIILWKITWFRVINILHKQVLLSYEIPTLIKTFRYINMLHVRAWLKSSSKLLDILIVQLNVFFLMTFGTRHDRAPNERKPLLLKPLIHAWGLILSKNNYSYLQWFELIIDEKLP